MKPKGSSKMVFPKGATIEGLDMFKREKGKRTVVTTQELADSLGYNPATVRKAADKGLIPTIKIGRNYRYDVEAVKLALSNQPQQPKK